MCKGKNRESIYEAIVGIQRYVFERRLEGRIIWTGDEVGVRERQQEKSRMLLGFRLEQQGR